VTKIIDGIKVAFHTFFIFSEEIGPTRGTAKIQQRSSSINRNGVNFKKKNKLPSVGSFLRCKSLVSFAH
jgi:hypothetical protein